MNLLPFEGNFHFVGLVVVTNITKPRCFYEQVKATEGFSRFT